MVSLAIRLLKNWKIKQGSFDLLALKAKEGFDLLIQKDIDAPPFTHIILGQPESGLYKGKEFVCWSDYRLDEAEKADQEIS